MAKVGAKAADDQVVACKHPNKMSAAGIKVCMDCGAPLNKLARSIAALKQI